MLSTGHLSRPFVTIILVCRDDLHTLVASIPESIPLGLQIGFKARPWHPPQSKLRIAYPEMFPIITAMLDTGLRAIVRDRETSNVGRKDESTDNTTVRGRRRTMSLNAKQPTVGTLIISLHLF